MKPGYPNRGESHSSPFQGGESAQAEGVVIQEPRSAPYFVAPNHPVCAAKEQDHFIDGAATPPWKGGEWLSLAVKFFETETICS